MIESMLEQIVEDIHAYEGTNRERIKETIENLMASDKDFSGHWAETGGIFVRSQEPDKYHYDIYLKIGCVWANHMGHTSDYTPTCDKLKKKSVGVRK